MNFISWLCTLGYYSNSIHNIQYVYQLGFQKNQVYLSCSKNGYIRLVTCSYIVCLMTFKLMMNLYTSVVKNNNMSRELTYLWVIL